MDAFCLLLLHLGLSLFGPDAEGSESVYACPPCCPPAVCSPAGPVPCMPIPIPPWVQCPVPIPGMPACTPYGCPAEAVARPIPVGPSMPPLPQQYIPVPVAAQPDVPLCAPCCPPPGPAPSPDEVLVKELIAVLDDTKSTDTFCLTAELLTSMQREGRRALPAIIRNADRLEVTRGMLKDESTWTKEQHLVRTCIRTLLEPGSGRGTCAPSSPACGIQRGVLTPTGPNTSRVPVLPAPTVNGPPRTIAY